MSVLLSQQLLQMFVTCLNKRDDDEFFNKLLFFLVKDSTYDSWLWHLTIVNDDFAVGLVLTPAYLLRVYFLFRVCTHDLPLL